MPVIDSLLRIGEFAKLAGVSQRTAWKLIKSDRAPGVVRIGRAVRVRASDVDLWIKLGCPNRERFEALKAERDAVRP